MTGVKNHGKTILESLERIRTDITKLTGKYSAVLKLTLKFIKLTNF